MTIRERAVTLIACCVTIAGSTNPLAASSSMLPQCSPGVYDDMCLRNNIELSQCEFGGDEDRADLCNALLAANHGCTAAHFAYASCNFDDACGPPEERMVCWVE